MGIERRVFQRKNWRSQIVFDDEFGEGLMYLYSKDISLGGIFLEEVPPIRIGTQLFVSFVLPGKKRAIRLTGQVVRFVETNEKGKILAGAGVRFSDLPENVFKQLGQFLQEP